MQNTSKTHRIAVASTDGKTINEHFGKAAEFLIYEIGKESQTFIEKRNVTPLSSGIQCGSGHTENSILSMGTSKNLTEVFRGSPIIDTLKDCTAVIAVKAGGAVRRAFEINGISVFEKADSIENALNKLAIYYAKTGGN